MPLIKKTIGVNLLQGAQEKSKGTLRAPVSQGTHLKITKEQDGDLKREKI